MNKTEAVQGKTAFVYLFFFLSATGEKKCCNVSIFNSTQNSKTIRCYSSVKPKRKKKHTSGTHDNEHFYFLTREAEAELISTEEGYLLNHNSCIVLSQMGNYTITINATRIHDATVLTLLQQLQ